MIHATSEKSRCRQGCCKLRPLSRKHENLRHFAISPLSASSGPRMEFIITPSGLSHEFQFPKQHFYFARQRAILKKDYFVQFVLYQYLCRRQGIVLQLIPSTIFITVTGHSRRKIRFPMYKGTGGKVGSRARKSISLIRDNNFVRDKLHQGGWRHLLTDCLKATKCTQNVI